MNLSSFKVTKVQLYIEIKKKYDDKIKNETMQGFYDKRNRRKLNFLKKKLQNI